MVHEPRQPKLQPRLVEPRPIRYVSRVLVAPDGSLHRARVPVYGAPEQGEIRLPEFSEFGRILGRRQAYVPRR